MQQNDSNNSGAGGANQPPDDPATLVGGGEASNHPSSSSRSTTMCKYFLSGVCKNGNDCQFSHDHSSGSVDTRCKFFMKGNCIYGDKCRYQHVKFPGWMGGEGENNGPGGGGAAMWNRQGPPHQGHPPQGRQQHHHHPRMQPGGEAAAQYYGGNRAAPVGMVQQYVHQGDVAERNANLMRLNSEEQAFIDYHYQMMNSPQQQLHHPSGQYDGGVPLGGGGNFSSMSELTSEELACIEFYADGNEGVNNAGTALHAEGGQGQLTNEEQAFIDQCLEVSTIGSTNPNDAQKMGDSRNDFASRESKYADSVNMGSQIPPLCTYSIKGNCRFGPERCRSPHGLPCPKCGINYLHPMQSEELQKLLHINNCRGTLLEKSNGTNGADVGSLSEGIEEMKLAN
eukprot:Nk52_evm52s212 gene=Nk52_evmTU52s212